MAGSALIGCTGFVGRHLARHGRYEHLIHRPNLESIRGARVERLVLCGLPAEKWRINQAPAEDLANMQRLQTTLASVTARTVVLISTVDVYPQPDGVDEASAVVAGSQSPYGAHRHAFEDWMRACFPHCAILRLPGLFGAGLKKNVLFDLLHGHQVERIDARGELQWYPVSRLADDIERLLALGLPLVNAGTEPLRTGEIAAHLFPWRDLSGVGTSSSAPPARYRMRSMHARHFGGRDGHWIDRVGVLTALRRWLESEPAWRERWEAA